MYQRSPKQNVSLRPSAGFTLIELMVTLSLIAMALMIGMINLSEFQHPTVSATSVLTGYFKQARGAAIATTMAYHIAPVNSRRISAAFSKSCSDIDTTPDSKLTLDLPPLSHLLDTGWSICFTPRGLATSNISFGVADSSGKSLTMEIMLGGAVRIS